MLPPVLTRRSLLRAAGTAAAWQPLATLASHSNQATYAAPPARPAGPALRVRLLAEAFPPLQYEHPHGTARGAAVDLALAALAWVGEQMAIEVAPLEFLPLQRTLMLASTQPDTLVLSVARTPEREDRYRWLGTVAPYELWLYRYRRPGQASITSIDQLRGRGLRIGVQPRSNFHEWLLRRGIGTAPDDTVIDTVAQNHLNFQKARAGRVDFFAHPAVSFPYRLAEQGMRAAEFEPVLRIDELSNPLWAAAGRDSNDRLCTLLTQALDILHRSGRAARLHDEALKTFNLLNKLD